MPNEPMPWQLTAGKLRRALQDVPDGAVVCLAVPPGSLGDAELTTVYNLRAEYSGGEVFKLCPGMPPGPDFEALADAAATHLEPAAGQPLPRSAIAVRLYQRLHGERQCWDSFKEGIITQVELRDVLLADAFDSVEDACPSWGDVDEDTRKALEQAFDDLLTASAP